MKKYLLTGVLSVALSLLASCGSGKTKHGPKSDTTSVSKDTLSVVQEYNLQSLKDSGSVQLASWITKNIPADKQVLRFKEASDLLKAIHYPLQPTQNLMAETIRDTSDTNQYIAYLYDERNFLLVFLMDTTSKKIMAVDDWSGEVADHFYRIARFGKSYIALLGHTSSGTENTYGFVFNKQLKKMLSLDQAYDCWSDEPYSSRQMHTEYTFPNDSTIRLDVEFKNLELEKVKKQYKMQLTYLIQKDTIVCTDPEKLKTYEKKRKEFSIE